MKRYVGLAAMILLLCGSNTSSTAQNLPSYMAPIAGQDRRDSRRHRDQGRAGAQHRHVRAVRRCRENLPEEHSWQAPGDPRAVFRRRRPADPLSARNAAARSTAGADRLSTDEVGRPQHDGAGRGRRALSGQCGRQILARLDARLPQPDAVGARRARCHADASRTGATTTAPSCRTTSPSWTNAWPRA